MAKTLEANEDVLGITEQDMEAAQKQHAIIPTLPNPHNPTPLAMVQTAIERNWDIDRLSKLLDLQERWRAQEARNAFEDAMAAFKAETIIIVKDKTNKQYDSKYTSIGNLVSTVTPYLSKHGLSASWDIDQSSGIRVACILTHRLGHSKSATVAFPPDKSGAKNPLQEIKSAITYGKICTFESVCGLASNEANLDDDGNGAGSVQGMPEDALDDYISNIQSASDLIELQKFYAEGYKAAKAAKDRKAESAIIRAKDARKAQLR